MNYQVKCPDCESNKLAMHSYERLALLCANCALVFTPALAHVIPDENGNLKRLMFMMNQFSSSSAIALHRELTGKSKQEAKELLANITFEDIKINKN